MISRQHRFKGEKNIMSVYRTGKLIRGQLLAIKYVTRPTDQKWRAAVVVSRKVNSSAVVRNRIRRRIYEFLRNIKPPLSSKIDLVITVYSDQIAIISSEKLIAEIEQLLVKIPREG